MQAYPPRVIVYSLATPSDKSQLLQQLISSGYTNAVTSNDLNHLKKLNGETSHAALVLQLTDATYCQTVISDILNCSESLPIIGLFSQCDSVWDQDIVASCDEIATWPCSNQELDFRIRKLTAFVWEERNLDRNLFVKMNILGKSPKLLEVLDTVCKIAKCDVPVAIDGETGTGKELIARAIHYLSVRKNYPFIAANCGAFPDQLIENELFGHDKGAYTDARESRDGLIAQVEGGTLFLDEIETLSPKGQITLLRFLEEMQYRPLGSNSVKTANVRIISATNEPFAQLVEDGNFRKDLYYRLNVINVILPPLRERSGDIKVLARHFIRRYQTKYNQHYKELHPRTLEGMQYYEWPGNVRELENILHREFLLTEGKYINIDEFESTAGERRKNKCDRRFQNLFCHSFGTAKTKLVSDFECQYLCSVLDRAKGNISKAARLAGKERRTFTRLLDKHAINSALYKNN